jgi:hypothetical protein
MTDQNTGIDSLKARLASSGLTREDLAWFDSLQWRDANVPPPASDEVDQYQRREAALNADIVKLGVLEKGMTLQGKLAAAIGARLADLRDQLAGEDD